MSRRLVLIGLAVVLLFAGPVFTSVWHAEIAPVEPLPRESFDPAQVALGARLAAIGNCNVCHTAPGGAPFAGGLALPTPFGTIQSTNITPDPATGIGRWSETAFVRAMREGVDREGRHLYPAFPYDHFTRVTDQDNRALYAYLMTRRPIQASPPPNDLRFPFDQRILLAGWKMLYLRQGPLATETDRSPEWNRGRYLVEGLGHCGACHTSRDGLGAEQRGAAYAGTEVENWAAYAINGQSPAPVPWDTASLGFYLRHGWHERHGVSRGPMAPVTANLGSVPEEDVAAIATYVADLMGKPGPDRVARGEAALAAAAKDASAPRPAPAGSSPGGAGEAIFVSACQGCHDGRRPPPFGGLNLHLSTAVNAPDPQNIINVTLFGLPGARGEPSAIMPGFKGVLGENQMVALLDYLRQRFSGRPPWADARERVAATLSGRKPVPVYRMDGTTQAPPEASMRTTSWP